mmetsp:Transcript_1902/g.3615  ORF Transcript_1902/g.3615 Transcript_1902/m.3615 type:complete len:204 (-) Transcript_1902:329-940(-)
MRLNHCFNPNQWLHMCVKTISHELEFSIRGNERNGAVVLKTSETNTLMELNVLKLDRLDASGGSPSGFKHELIIETELQFRHTRQERLHLNTANDLRMKNGTIGGNQQIQLLHNIQEDLILAMFDSFSTPRHGIGEGDRRARRHFQPITLLSDHLSKNSRLAGLGVSEIHCLIEQLIHNNKIITNTLFFDFAKVIFENIGQTI